MLKLTRYINWMEIKEQFQKSLPFNHAIIDNFFLPEIAEQLSKEFPSYNNPGLGFYNNAIENKKVSNKWDKFPKLTYQTFTYLAREEFVNNMRYLIDEPELHMDVGLNGGGWHMHGSSGNLNVHLDYNIHPKLGEQRKLNIIIYMSKDWNEEWGGGLELWSHDPINFAPKDLVKVVPNKFNRAVIFDTTQHSWHGLPTELKCPEGVVRQSLAAYYVKPAPEGSDPRGKALFAPTESQKGNPEIEQLIKERSSVNLAEKYYRGDK